MVDTVFVYYIERGKWARKAIESAQLSLEQQAKLSVSAVKGTRNSVPTPIKDCIEDGGVPSEFKTHRFRCEIRGYTIRHHITKTKLSIDRQSRT